MSPTVLYCETCGRPFPPEGDVLTSVLTRGRAIIPAALFAEALRRAESASTLAGRIGGYALAVLIVLAEAGAPRPEGVIAASSLKEVTRSTVAPSGGGIAAGERRT